MEEEEGEGEEEEEEGQEQENPNNRIGTVKPNHPFFSGIMYFHPFSSPSSVAIEHV